MLPIMAPKPIDWTDKDKWVCVARWLDALSRVVYNTCEESPNAVIENGKKGDPCFECPAGQRCPAYCDAVHWKRYTDFYAYENFKIVEQFSGLNSGVIDTILKEINDANLPKDISPA